MPDAKTLLGFDYGKQRIGVAVGQTLTHTVTPLITLRAVNQKPDWTAIGKLIAEWQPDLLVVGLPLHMDGTEQEMTVAARRFGNQLKGRYNLPVAWMDERLSSNEAEDLLRQQGGKTRQDKTDIDKLAAGLILQSWLDQQETT
ncbi:MAG: Holliday junction resolvase RuvX [Gammaproteobacteria bacterium]|nr:Holliday junction resolvase RuvX [Gammaproteobacteria bacterium]MDH5650375.1 Holliday junction resolvase RuvX [Gammaproteobacteria bacterium]